MSIIKTDPLGFTPRDTEQNWAAEYARRLVVNETKARIESDEEIKASQKTTENRIDGLQSQLQTEEAARKAADSSLSERADELQSKLMTETNERKAADTAEVSARQRGDSDTLRAAKEYTDKTALKEIPPASINVLGGIKPLPDGSGTINRSGLVISEDGTTYVNTRADRGITRDGAGQIGINPATDDEVAAGNEVYKPVTPKTLYNEFYRRGVYTTHPEKVGMWINGTPIWRMAINIKLTDADYQKGYYTLTGDDLGVDFPDSIQVILNAHLRVYHIHGATESYSVEISEAFTVVLKDSEAAGARLIGCIEFVVDSSKIKEV